MTSTQWVEYHVGTKRKTYNSLPTPNITAEAVKVGGGVFSQTDAAEVRMLSYNIYGEPESDSHVAVSVTHFITETRNGKGRSIGYAYSKNGTVKNDTFGAASRTEYTAVGDSTPTFDADGNQTLMKTTTGIWSITYDAENRPVRFTNAETNTVIECGYDYMGRRATKKVTVDGTITLHQRYLYRGYLQIACCDLARSAHPCLWLITWDPTQPIATRPLAIQKDGTWFTYGWDLTKNVCEIYGTNGYIRTSYTYSPYGEVTESGNTWQPIQWSSEYNDTELGLVYYNYRHYNPLDGRWIGRDFIYHRKSRNAYFFCSMITNTNDVLGLIPKEEVSLVFESLTDDFFDNIIRWWYDDPVRIDEKKDFSPNLYPCNDNMCIKKITFIAHGEKSEIDKEFVNMYLRDGSILTESEEHKEISNYFKGFRYCKNGCEIELIICYLGVSKYLKANIENVTGCRVKLYGRKVNGLFPELNLPWY